MQKIDVYEGRDIIVIGVPNTLVQTNMHENNGILVLDLERSKNSSF